MKTYQQHNCTANHRTYKKFAKCAIKRAAWVEGEGEFAVIAWCRVPTVSLYSDLAVAMSRLAHIDSGCGGFCHGHHEIVVLEVIHHRVGATTP